VGCLLAEEKGRGFWDEYSKKRKLGKREIEPELQEFLVEHSQDIEDSKNEDTRCGNTSSRVLLPYTE
jgi:hypothetical protein